MIEDDVAGFACGKSNLVEQGVVHLRPFNIGLSGEIDLTSTYQIPADAVPKGRGELHAGDILFNNTNSAELVGKAAIVESDFCAGFSNHLTRIRVNKQVALPKYLLYVLLDLREKGTFTAAATQWVSQAAYRVSDLKQLPIRLPPLAEQQRIVEILDRAAAIQRLRRAAEEKAREIIPALFVDMFGDPVNNPKGWPIRLLKEAADIGSGVTKGRKIDGKATIDVPYLRVANVQDGFLDLTEIKTITIMATEREKYALEVGDVVMTEGGDLDKLGRGYVWNGELPYCAHQNHVFRVRADRTQIDPLFLAAFIQSFAGKSYFLRVAKRTTGIASINKTQLSDMPLWLPPVELQREFSRRVSAVNAVVTLHGNATKLGQDATNALALSMLATG
ncbi:MAG: restriction endonuclease subunit S [Roseomonas sp.]|nr:restriction endonuclease subunit S [Roseomonas sp.]